MIFISVVRNKALYAKVIQQNGWLKVADFVSFDNIKSESVPILYNQFISAYDYNEENWFVFCHDDWELREDIGCLLDGLDKTKLYGPIGVILYPENNMLVREYRGSCYEKKRDGTNERQLLCWRHWTGLDVDTFDGQCVIVHSTLVKQCNLRFDENLMFDLYVEDFCIWAKIKHGIQSKIINVNCCHWSQIEEAEERHSYYEKLPYINAKYKDFLFGGTISLVGGKAWSLDHVINLGVSVCKQERSMVYQTDVAKVNDPRRFSIDWIDDVRISNVLDVGCACGDFVGALAKEKNIRAWGMEYDQGSIKIANKGGLFEEIFHVNLNDFDLNQFQKMFSFFDYIVIGDVLEHLQEPSMVLEKLMALLKAEGHFLISLPNIAHSSIKVELLSNNFTYTPVGILDKTHLRFFTHKTIPEFLGKLSLKIEEVRVTGMDYGGFQPKGAFTLLPRHVKKFILKDYYSFVCQFVMKISVDSSSSLEEIIRSNAEKLELNTRNVSPLILKLMCYAHKKELGWYTAFYQACVLPMRVVRYKLLAKVHRGVKREHYLKKRDRLVRGTLYPVS